MVDAPSPPDRFEELKGIIRFVPAGFAGSLALLFSGVTQFSAKSGGVSPHVISLASITYIAICVGLISSSIAYTQCVFMKIDNMAARPEWRVISGRGTDVFLVLLFLMIFVMVASVMVALVFAGLTLRGLVAR